MGNSQLQLNTQIACKCMPGSFSLHCPKFHCVIFHPIFHFIHSKVNFSSAQFERVNFCKLFMKWSRKKCRTLFWERKLRIYKCIFIDIFPWQNKIPSEKLLLLMPFCNALKTKTMFCQQCRKATKLHYYFFPWPWNVLPNPTHHTIFFLPQTSFFMKAFILFFLISFFENSWKSFRRKERRQRSENIC